MKKHLFIIIMCLFYGCFAAGQSFVKNHHITKASMPGWSNSFDIADIDNDGDFDIIASSRGENSIYKIENLGDFKFSVIEELYQFYDGMKLDKIVATDVDQNGYVDIIYSNTSIFGRIKWLKNIGNYLFEDAGFIYGGSYNGDESVSFFVEDLNNDQYPDLIIDGQLKVKLNTGDGLFSPDSEPIVVDNKASFRQCLDFDGDDDPDILYIQRDPYKFVLAKNDGEGGFISQSNIDSSQIDLIVGFHSFDLDNDDDNDIIGFTENDSIVILINHGDSTFQKEVTKNDLLFSYSGLTSIDLDDDGDLDLINNYFETLINNGDNTFSYLNDNKTSYSHVYKFADINNDEKSDLVDLSVYGSMKVFDDFLENYFSLPKPITSILNNPVCPAFININGSSGKELCVNDKLNSYVFFQNIASTTPMDVRSYDLLHNYSSTSIFFDINHDGLADIISFSDKDYPHPDTTRFKIAQNIGNSEFIILSIDEFNHFESSHSEFADYNSNGDINLVMKCKDTYSDLILFFEFDEGFNLKINDTIQNSDAVILSNFKFADIDQNSENDFLSTNHNHLLISYSQDGKFSNQIDTLYDPPSSWIVDYAVAQINSNDKSDVIIGTSNDKLFVLEDYEESSFLDTYQIPLEEHALTIQNVDLNYDGIDEIIYSTKDEVVILTKITKNDVDLEKYNHVISVEKWGDVAPFIFDDMDLDGDIDVICTLSEISNLSWFENSFILQNFPMQNAIWTEQNAMYESNPAQTWTSLYKTESDTILNGKQYTNVYEYHIDPVLFDTVKNLYASIRQEILQKKVYVIRHYLNDESEKLLLNFNVEEGDTVILNAYHWNLNPYFNDSSFIVDSIRPVELKNGEPSRKHFLSNHDNGYPLNLELIEGVGSLVHPFGPKNDLLTKFSGISSELCCPEQLLCLTVDGEQVYQLSEESVCGDLEVWTSLQELTNRNFFDIYPNPTKEKLNINLLRSPQNAYEVSIYNNIGRKLISRSFEKQQVTLDIRNLDTGIYFLAISNGNECSTVKFVVID